MIEAIRQLPHRAYNAPVVHRVVPSPVAWRLVQARARYAWAHNAQRREEALAGMEFLLGKSARAGDVEACARASLLETYKRAEIIWRPWLLEAQRIEHRERLLEAHATGRGVIINYMHHGHYPGMFSSFRKSPFELHMPAHPAVLAADAMARQRYGIDRLREVGVHLFSAAGSYPHMAKLLGAGEVLVMAMDLPGSLPMTFLGRRVKAASGVARLALEVGSLVVPVTASPHGWLQSTHFQEPIDPSGFDSPEALQAEIARRHEPAILAWPQAVEDPLTRWTPQH